MQRLKSQEAPAEIPNVGPSLTGIQPKSLADALAAELPTIQDKWFAPLYLIKPIVFIVLSTFWVGTGIISLTLGYGSGADLMRNTGAGFLSGPAVLAGALADIAVGSGTVDALCALWRARSPAVLRGGVDGPPPRFMGRAAWAAIEDLTDFSAATDRPRDLG